MKMQPGTGQDHTTASCELWLWNLGGDSRMPSVHIVVTRSSSSKSRILTLRKTTQDFAPGPVIHQVTS